jgi:mono/diheme cytochrome c family protein
MRVRVLAFLASTLVLSTAVALRATYATQPRTTNDGIYTKAQADGAKAQFDKICAECHAFTVAAKKKAEDLPLGDDPFFRNWEGKTIDELVSVIVLTMPNDGSAVVDEPEALNLMAFVLQQNGFPAGTAPLTKATATAVVARPKR